MLSRMWRFNMNSRRKFLSLITGGAAAAATTALSANDHIKYTPDRPLIYKGYKVFWTGWKSIPQQAQLVGQWLACLDVQPPRRGFYASTPGGEGHYLEGENFDLSRRRIPSQAFITVTSTREEADAEMWACLERLKDLLGGFLRHCNVTA